MRKIRLCIGSNDDGEHVAKTHMGDTQSFHIFDLFEDKTYEFIEKRTNTVQEMDHAKSGKMEKILGIIEDVDVLVANQKSPNFVNIAQKTQYQPVIVKTVNISDVLNVIHDSFNMIYEYVAQKKAGGKQDIIPEL